MTKEGPGDGCKAWLEDQGQCVIEDPDHELPHALINIDHDITWKVLWPMSEDDPAVKRYHAIAEAYMAKNP